jgi:hypothetical protein
MTKSSHDIVSQIVDEILSQIPLEEKSWCQTLTDCCPNKNLFERSLKRFLFIILGEVKEKRFKLFEPEGRVLESPGTRLRFIKKCFRASEK